MCKVQNDFVPNYLRQKLSYVFQINKHTLRSSNVYGEYGKKCYSYSGTAIWNAIPGGIGGLRNLRGFRMHC